MKWDFSLSVEVTGPSWGRRGGSVSDGGGGCGGLNGLIFESGMKKKEHSVFNRIIRPCY